MPALADLQWAAENAKGWLKLSPRACQLGMFLYNPQLLCTTMIYKAVLSSGKTSLFIQNVTSPSPQPVWLLKQSGNTNLWSSLTSASAGMASFLRYEVLTAYTGIQCQENTNI